MSSKREEFKQRVKGNPLIVSGLQKIENEEQRKRIEATIDASCEELGAMFEMLSTALEDPEILKQVVEEFRKQNNLVNNEDGSSVKK